MAEENASNPFTTLFEIMLTIFVVLFCAYVANFFLNFLPVPTGASNVIYAPLHTLYNGTFVFFDNSFMFILILLFIIDAAYAYWRPNKAVGIANMFLLFVLAFFSLLIRIIVITYQFALNFSVLMPNTYAFFNSNYYLVLTFFF